MKKTRSPRVIWENSEMRQRRGLTLKRVLFTNDVPNQFDFTSLTKERKLDDAMVQSHIRDNTDPNVHLVIFLRVFSSYFLNLLTFFLFKCPNTPDLIVQKIVATRNHIIQSWFGEEWFHSIFICFSVKLLGGVSRKIYTWIMFLFKIIFFNIFYWLIQSFLKKRI